MHCGSLITDAHGPENHNFNFMWPYLYTGFFFSVHVQFQQNNIYKYIKMIHELYKMHEHSPKIFYCTYYVINCIYDLLKFLYTMIFFCLCIWNTVFIYRLDSSSNARVWNAKVFSAFKYLLLQYLFKMFD